MSVYSYSTVVSDTFTNTVTRLKETLAQEGFGVLTEIDVQATMAAKLNKVYEPYIILGACNPLFADQALQSEVEIGLLLPCNVIVYQKNEIVHVAVIKPTIAMSIVENDTLAGVAKSVEEKLIAAAEKLVSTT